MGLVDGRHHADPGTGQGCQFADLLQAITGQLQHGDLVLRLQPAQGDRKPVAVVIVAIVAKDGMALGQNRRRDFFRRRLAAGTGDAYHTRLQLVQDKARPIQQSLAAVLHDHAGDAIGVQIERTLAQHACGSLASSIQHVIVAVALVGDDGQEKLARLRRRGNRLAEQARVVAEIGKGVSENLAVDNAPGRSLQIVQADQSLSSPE